YIQYVCTYIKQTQCNIIAVYGMPWGGPSSNSAPAGGPAWNGGDTTDNIILRQNGGGSSNKWRY
ncbi:hypothetical protein KR215_000340, partial [Drosophila sulfurigaster]